MKGWTSLKGLFSSLLRSVDSSIGTIPPRDLTVTRITLTEIRIKDYWKANGRLPMSLSELPILKDRDNAIDDAWGRPIKYDVIGATTVVLSSFGANGVAGGMGVNEDIVVSFNVKTEESAD
jgi:hypothetical protein